MIFLHLLSVGLAEGSQLAAEFQGVAAGVA
jgi:hypothetical protein